MKMFPTVAEMQALGMHGVAIMSADCDICKARAEATRERDALVKRTAEAIALRLLILRADLTANLTPDFRDEVIAEVNRRIT